MTEKHITFEQLSDLFDDMLATEDDKEQILAHLEVCPQCLAEYEKLKKTVAYAAALKGPAFITKNLPERIITTYKTRHKKKNFIKSLPAIAASILIIIGVAFIDGGRNRLDNKFAIKSANTLSGIEKLNQVLNKHKARILKITDLYTECEIDAVKFNALRRDLGFRKVTYKVVRSTSLVHAPHNWRDIEEVGAGNIITEDKAFADNSMNDIKTAIRFRVYR